MSLRSRVGKLERRRLTEASDRSACAACGGLGRLAFVLAEGGPTPAPRGCERCGRTLLHVVSVDEGAPGFAAPLLSSRAAGGSRR